MTAKKKTFKSSRVEKAPDPSQRKPKQAEISLLKKGVGIGVVLVATYCLWFVINLFLADVSYATGRKLNQAGRYEEAIEHFAEAARLNPREPAYHRDYAYALAQLAKEDEGLIEIAIDEAQTAYRLNPKNSLTLKKLVSVYYALAEIDSKYNLPLLQLSLEITNLSPTEPRPHYDQALIFVKFGLKEKAIEAVAKALELKPNYPEAQQLYDILTSES